MKLVSLTANNGSFPTSHQHKKYKVVLEPKKTIYFGDNRYDDFTSHHDEARKQNYLTRHRARENFHDPTTAGFWSANLLWNKPTIAASLRDIKRRFNL
jgi:hypothetical protein